VGDREDVFHASGGPEVDRVRESSYQRLTDSSAFHDDRERTRSLLDLSQCAVHGLGESLTDAGLLRFVPDDSLLNLCPERLVK
jgi:hypothetical protein